MSEQGDSVERRFADLERRLKRVEAILQRELQAMQADEDDDARPKQDT